MESDKRKIIAFGIFSIALLISVVSAGTSIEMSVGLPKIISVGQETNSEDFYPEVILSVGIKNIGNYSGGFRLFVETDGQFRLRNDWHGALEPNETKNLQLKLISDPGFYGRGDYKIIFEDILSGERDVYEDSFYFQQEIVVGDKPESSNIIKTTSFFQSVFFYLIVISIILIGLAFYLNKK